MSDTELWGKSQVPDAKIITPCWYNDNERLPTKGIELEYLPEHALEIQRCAASVEYFAENYYKITVGGNKKALMQLWPIQRRAIKHFQKHNRVVMNSSRQTSKTTLVVLFVLWNLLFGNGLQNIGMLGNKFELAKLNLDKVKEAYENLPIFLKPTVEKWNEKQILFEDGNECKITSTSSTSFRGSTLTSLVIDEAAFVNEGGKLGLDKEILQSLLPTLDAVGDDGFCILVSTPYGMHNEFARLYHLAKDKPEKTAWRHFEMLWSDHPDRDQEWYNKKVLEMGSEQAFYVEFGGSFTMGDEITRIIDGEVKMFQLDNHVKDPLFTQNWDLSVDNDEDDQSLRIWEFPARGRIYIAGVDCAEGTGECYSTIVVLDITDLTDIRQVCEYQNNKIGINDFPLVILKVLNAYNQPWAVIERNNCGGEIVSALHKAHGYTKLIRHGVNPDATERMIKQDQYGMVSHNNTKNMAASNLLYFLNRAQCITIRSKYLLRELDGFVKTTLKNNNWKWGKIGGDGSYDDLADAFMWAICVLHQKMVEEYFILSDPKFNDKSKPIHITEEVKSQSGDGRYTNSGLLLNQTGQASCVYTVGGYAESEIDGFDLEWLQNF